MSDVISTALATNEKSRIMFFARVAFSAQRGHADPQIMQKSACARTIRPPSPAPLPFPKTLRALSLSLSLSLSISKKKHPPLGGGRF